MHAVCTMPAVMQALPLDIVYEDDVCLVVNKVTQAQAQASLWLLIARACHRIISWPVMRCNICCRSWQHLAAASSAVSVAAGRTDWGKKCCDLMVWCALHTPASPAAAVACLCSMLLPLLHLQLPAVANGLVPLLPVQLPAAVDVLSALPSRPGAGCRDGNAPSTRQHDWHAGQCPSALLQPASSGAARGGAGRLGGEHHFRRVQVAASAHKPCEGLVCFLRCMTGTQWC